MDARFVAVVALAPAACGAPTPASGPAVGGKPPEIFLLASFRMARAGTNLEVSFHVDEPLERSGLEVAGVEGTCGAEIEGQASCSLEVDRALAERGRRRPPVSRTAARAGRSSCGQTGSMLQAVSVPCEDVIYAVGSSRNVPKTTLGGC